MKPAKGAKVVGYRPVTGRPTNPDGSLRLVFEYERPARRAMGIDLARGSDHACEIMATVDERGDLRVLSAKPVRRIVDRGIPKQGALI